MKEVKITNATVTPLNRNKPTEFIRVNNSKTEGSTLKIINFNIETKVTNNPKRNGRLFESCTFFAKDEAESETVQKMIKEGAVLELKGYEDRKCTDEEKKIFRNYIVVSDIVELTNIKSTTTVSNPETEEDLPF